jgi:HEAT repeat protein
MLDPAAEPDVRAALLEALHHPNAGVRTRAVAALGPLAAGDQAVTQALLDMLTQDSHNEPRLLAARVLGATRRPPLAVLTALGAAILDGDKATRKEAITGYRSWDADSRGRILTMIRAALRDPAQERRRKTLELMAEISLVLRDDARDLLLEAVKDETNSDVALLVPLIKALGSVPEASDEVQTLLLTWMKHQHPQVCITSVKALSDLGVRSQAAVQELVAALSSNNTALRKAAATALGTIGTPEQAAISALEQALFDRDEFVGLNALHSLLRLGVQRSEVQERLATLLQSTNAERRLLAVQAVQGIVRTLSPAIIAILVKHVSDSYRNVSEHALRALAELGPAASEEIIASCRAGLLHTYPPARAYAAEALGRMGRAEEATITALLVALTDDDANVRLAASGALTALGQGKARETIIHQVRAKLDQNPRAEGVFNTLWDMVVGE